MHITLLIVALNFAQIQTDNDMEGRVVKGRPTIIERHPHSVFLYIWSDDYGAHICGGSIINQRVILTAAHCFEYFSRAIAKVGTADIKMGNAFLVKSWIYHPRYDPDQIINDIALAGLDKEIEFGMKVKRIVIAKKRRNGGYAKVAGWGMVQEFPEELFSDYLHEVSIPIMSKEKCITILKKMHAGTFCAGKLGAASYPAAGDSGSPLVIKNYMQIGLVSFRNNHFSRSVVVFTDVTYFYKWIVDNARTVFCKEEEFYNSSIYEKDQYSNNDPDYYLPLAPHSVSPMVGTAGLE